ncbi:MAG: cation:proton antiporter [Planctomycetota bacterium]
MTEELILNLLLVLAAGLFAGLICRALGTSVLIGYLVAGALLGRGVLGLVIDEEHQMEHYAEAGVFLLLFSIGLEFAIDDLKRLGRNLLVGGTLQMGMVAVPVAAVLIAWGGMAWQSAWLIAVAMAFNSTVLVFKALSQWGHTQKSHGRRAIGLLLFQDAALVPLLLVVPLLTGTGEIRVMDYVFLAGISVCFVAAIVVMRSALATRIIPRMVRYRSPDLVVLFTVVVLGGVTLVAYRVGLPPAVGAFAAGLIFNGNRWTRQIDALVLPLRETFAAVFFVGLGLIFDPRLFWDQPLLMFGMLATVVVVKSLAATLSLVITGLTWGRAIGMGMGLGQVGEFAFVLALLGVESGVIVESDYQKVVAIAVGSLVITPSLMKWGLRFIKEEDQNLATLPDDEGVEAAGNQAIVIGAGPIGRQIASHFETTGWDVCVVDRSDINLHEFSQSGFRTVAGEAAEEETMTLAEVARASLVVVCVPNDSESLRIVQLTRRLNSAVRTVVRCRYQGNVASLFKAGADHVVAEEVEASNALLRVIASLPRDA